jgi:hypothetical protein
VAGVHFPPEPLEEVERPVHRDAQGDAGRHHRADVDAVPQPAHRSEENHGGKHVGNHGHQSRAKAAKREHHHDRHQPQRSQEAVEQVGEQLLLDFVHHRGHPGVGGVYAVVTVRFVLGNHRLDAFPQPVEKTGVIEIGLAADVGADPPPLVTSFHGQKLSVDQVVHFRFETATQHGPLHRISNASGRRNGGEERPGRHGAAQDVDPADPRLGFAYQLQSLEGVERTVGGEMDDDLHRHGGPDVLLKPVQVPHRAVAGRKERGHVDRRLQPHETDPRQP